MSAFITAAFWLLIIFVVAPGIRKFWIRIRRRRDPRKAFIRRYERYREGIGEQR